MPTRLRPTPALIVATLALVVALGGTSYAAVKIDGSAIADHSIAGDKLKKNTVTGKQIKESSLDPVPQAANADHAGNADHATSASQAANADAVGGIVTRTVFYAPATEDATPTKILQLGGLVLTATCGNGDLDVTVTSTVDHAHLSSEMWNSAQDGRADGLHHSDFGPNSASHLDSLSDGNAYGETSFTYTRANGIIVSGQLSFDSSDLNVFHPGDGNIFNNTAKCMVSGFVNSTTAAP
jgi:hypothetical protein